MKKIITLLLAGMLVISFTACSSDDETSLESSSTVSDTESSEVGEIGDLLLNSFVNLLSGSKYYIDVTIVAETYSTESSKSESTTKYSYAIAVDSDNVRAGLDMTTNKNEKVSIVIKDSIGYEIVHDSKQVTTHTSDVDVAEFGSAYTTYLWIGYTGGITLTSSGMTKYNNTECDYERYLVSSDVTSGTDTATITYYFKDGTPIAEVFESSTGKTTFTFNKVSSDIDESIFDVPNDYEIISGDTSSEI